MNERVLSGIDTLEVGYCLVGELSEEDVALLDGAKTQAQEEQFDSPGCPVAFHGREFRMMPRGVSGKEWRIENDDVSLALAREWNGGRVFPEAHCVYRSKFLWREGWEAAEAKMRAWLGSWAAVVGDKVSRVDLTADLACPCPDVDIRGHEVTGTVVRRDDYASGSHARGHRLTGYTFGGGDMVARIYDKQRKAKEEGKTWFFPMWKKNGWDGECPVTRTEFEFKRDMLKQWQVNTVKDLAACTGDLWRFATETWLKLRITCEADSNYRRWPVSEFWEAVQSAVDSFGTVTGVSRLKQVQPEYRRLLKGARGYLASAIAVASTGGLGKGHGWFVTKHWLHELMKSEEFRDLVEARRAKFATM
ncbi:MAG: hypothetical protein M0R22_01270 [Dehalococcoidia bacterium]|jgi:hypothetical protein|nr:hypothetical protein [Dehalococcoidia bacterium]